jgi:hypothetical protein
MIAHAKLVIIARAANRLANKGKVWKPNFADHNQYKYTPWFYHGRVLPGFGSASTMFGVRVRLSALAFALSPGR